MRLALQGRSILVTGGSRGIGRAVCEVAARLGARVGVHYARDEATALDTVATLRARGATAVALRADLGSPEGAGRLVEAAHAALGPLRGLVVNHGIWKPAPLATMTGAQWEETLAVNLRSARELCQAALPRLASGAAVVLVASTAGQRGEAGYAHYAASKGGLIALARSLADELAPAVRVNAIAPGWVLTDMTREALAGEGGADARAKIPVGRPARPEEIAGPIAFLLSDASAFVWGEVMGVNGGAVTAP